MIKKKYYMIWHYNHPDSGRPSSEYIIYKEDSPDLPNLKEYHFLRIVSDSEQGVIEEWQHNSKKRKLN